MPPRLDDTRRDAILADIQAIADGQGDRSARAVARTHNVSVNSVTRIADAAGLSEVWGRVQTERATRARNIDMASERGVLKSRLLEAAHDLLDQLDEPYTAYSFGGKDNSYNEHEFSRPPAEIARQLMTSAAIALDKHALLDKHDSDDGADAGRSMIEGLALGLESAYRRSRDADATPAESVE